MSQNAISVKPVEDRYLSQCSSKFPLITESTHEQHLNTTVKSRLDEIEENSHFLSTMSFTYKDLNKVIKKPKIRLVNTKLHSLSKTKTRTEENIKPIIKIKTHRKIFSFDNKKETKRIKFNLNPIPKEKKQISLSPPPNNINSIKYKTFRTDILKTKINKISSCEEKSSTKFNVFKAQLSKTLSQLSTPTKSLENIKKFTNVAPMTDVLSKKYKSKRVFIYKNNNFLTDELRSKDILCQYNQISKIAPIEIYRLRKELCYQMGLNLIEKENEIGFEKRYKKNMMYVTPKWVYELKEKQKKEMQLINEIREKTMYKANSILKSNI